MSTETPPVEDAFDPNAALESLIDDLPDVTHGRVQIMQRAKTQRDLAALTAAIEAHGAAPALLAFANYNGVLGAAVPSIPALEALTGDISEEQARQIVADLKALNLEPATEDTDGEDAEESLAGAFAEGFVEGAGGGFGTIVALLGMIGNVIAPVAAFEGLQHWNTYGDDKEGRLTKVVPFQFIADHLQAVAELPRIGHELASLTLPKTEEEWTAFQKKVDAVAAPLAVIGVHVAGEDVKVDAFPKPVKNNIETLGYHESALADIADMAEKAKAAIGELKANKFEEFNSQLMAADKADKKYLGSGMGLATDVYVTAVRRAAKVIKLTKVTVGAIKHFYKQG